MNKTWPLASIRQVKEITLGHSIAHLIFQIKLEKFKEQARLFDPCLAERPFQPSSQYFKVNSHKASILTLAEIV